MITKRLRLTAGFLAAVLTISSVPAEAFMGSNTAEVTGYITGGTYSFSAGAHAAINETVVMIGEDDELLADNETDVTENEAPIVAEPEVDEPDSSDTIVEDEVEETPEESETPEAPVNEFANIAIATGISSYLNVRAEANSDAEILGKMYKNNAAIVLEQVGEWYKVQTGSMTGYIHSKYVTVGDEAVCKAAATITAKITTNSLRLRKKATTDSGVHTLLGKGNTVTVLDDSIDGWLKVKYNSYTGYIAEEYADVVVTYTYGESKEEEAAREAAEKAAAEKEAAKKKAEEEAKKQQAASSNKNYKNPTGSDGQAVVDYAVQFVGNKYVWGGESLTNGVDCSGFIMKVYEKFGIDLPHSSYKLRSVGVKVSESDLQPGDIICYSGHVALYIGDGKIVHAANKKKGIIISDNYKYKKILAIRRVL